jgi:hypothetical protein
MLDENLIATLEQILHQTRNEQNRLYSKLREAEAETEQLRHEIAALENSAAQTEQAIDSLLVTMRSSGRTVNIDRARPPRSIGTGITIEDEQNATYPRRTTYTPNVRRDNPVAYMPHTRIPSIGQNIEPISNRFSDRTITQACTLLLREANGPLHVNELYNLLVAGGMKFKGNNPTISIAVSLNRNKRFRKVDPGTFDLVIRDASQQHTGS